MKNNPSTVSKEFKVLTEKEWEEIVQKVADGCKPAVALYFPGGTLGAESSPESTSFYANEKAKEAGVIVV